MANEPIPQLAGCELQLDALREVGAMFWQRGWSVGTSSNYSVRLSRDPLELAVTVSGKDKGRLARADFVRVGADGRPTSADQPKSSAETMLHVVLAQEEKVGAVLHTHSIWGTLLSDFYHEEEGFAIEGYEMLKGLAGVATHEHREWIPIYENTQDIPSLAERVAARRAAVKYAGEHGFLIRRHGLYTWGETVADARRHIEIFEFLFEAVARRLMLAAACSPGMPLVMPPIS